MTESVRSHTGVRPFSCSMCGKCFTRKDSLIKHTKFHTGETAFSCSVCGKPFAAKDKLIEHERVHTGEKPFSCTECGKAFALKGTMIRHVRTHTGERPFSCIVCGKSFSLNSDFTKHERIHTGEKPFSCHVCGISFTNRSGLTRHCKRHVSNGGVTCFTCGKTFLRKTDLSDHLKTHTVITSKKPLSSTVCGTAFNHRPKLNAHKRFHTSEKSSKTLTSIVEDSCVGRIEVRPKKVLEKDDSPSFSVTEPCYGEVVDRRRDSCCACGKSFLETDDVGVTDLNLGNIIQTVPYSQWTMFLQGTCAAALTSFMKHRGFCSDSEDFVIFCKKCTSSCLSCALCGMNVKSVMLRTHLGHHTGQMVKL